MSAPVGYSTRDLPRDVLANALLTALWVVPLWIIGSHGEFPLNDDWAYARATSEFLETGHFERDVWTYTPVITDVARGALFSSILGFSFETLRLSGVFMGWIGLLGSYWLCRQVGVATAPSMLGAAVVGFNPIYLNLSYTFMTDVPFTALVTWSLVLLARGLATSSRPALAGGLAFALAASLSRQPGLAIAAALVLAVGASGTANVRRLLLPFGAVVAVGGVVGLWLAGALESLSWLREFAQTTVTNPRIGRFLAQHSLTSFGYLGWFLSPVVGLVLWARLGIERRLAIGCATFSGLALIGLAASGRRMPLGSNVLYDLGLGPATVNGAMHLPGAPEWQWWLVTVVAVVAGSFAIALIAAEAVGEFRRRSDALLLLAFSLIYLAPLLATPNFFDRYLLPVLAPLTAILLASATRSARASWRAHIFAIGLLAPLATFGVMGTRDYLEHNRARWALLDQLIARDVPADQVDGGFEFDGWSGLDPAVQWRRRGLGAVDEFIVSHLSPQELPRYRLIDSRNYRRLLPPRNEAIGLYERIDPADKTR